MHDSPPLAKVLSITYKSFSIINRHLSKFQKAKKELEKLSPRSTEIIVLQAEIETILRFVEDYKQFEDRNLGLK